VQESWLSAWSQSTAGVRWQTVSPSSDGRESGHFVMGKSLQSAAAPGAGQIPWGGVLKGEGSEKGHVATFFIINT
jgi:hypothetical protein